MTEFSNKAEKPRFHTSHEGKGIDLLASRPVSINLAPVRESDQRRNVIGDPLQTSSKKEEESAAGLRAIFQPDIDLNRVALLKRRPSKGCAFNVFESDSAGFAAEQFRLMQRRLTNVRPGGGIVLLTSPGTCDGKSLNAHHLAWALSEAKQSTLLLELDLRRPTQVRYFGAEITNDIAKVLSCEVSPTAAVRRIEALPLYFLGLSQPAEDPIALLRSNALVLLMEWCRRNFKWIVIDAPPILPVADVEELLPSADLVLMVVRERLTPCEMVERAADRLGKRLSYFILNDVTISKLSGYEYGYK